MLNTPDDSGNQGRRKAGASENRRLITAFDRRFIIILVFCQMIQALL
jgi:hypothetical protein